jgi:hypothetical protein
MISTKSRKFLLFFFCPAFAGLYTPLISMAFPLHPHLQRRALDPILFFINGPGRRLPLLQAVR